MTTTTTEILCPTCQVNTVPAVSWEFSQTSVDVPVCDYCQLTGIVSATVRVTGMADLELPIVSVRHRHGFVELGHKGRSWTAR